MQPYQWKLAPVIRRATIDPGLSARPRTVLEEARADLQELRKEPHRDRAAEAMAQARIERLAASQGRRRG